MKAALSRALVIGGGIAGTSAAIELRKRGVSVDLVERYGEWRAYGAGITINGAALRAFAALGVVKDVMDRGWCSDGCDYAPRTASYSRRSRLPGSPVLQYRAEAGSCARCLRKSCHMRR